jgi:hypothetical protein
MAEAILDVVLVVLLAASIIWSARLHRRLTRLRADRAELESFIEALANATARAETATAGLKAAGRELHRDLARQEAATRQLIDRLRREGEGAGRILRRLDEVAARASAAPGAAPRPAPTAPPASESVAPGSGEPPADGRIPPDVMRALQSLR